MMNIGSLLGIVFVVAHLKLLLRLLLYNGQITLSLPISWTRTSYLEMVGKYRAGYIGDRKSGEYFKQGMLYTFYDIPPSAIALLNAFYAHIRNGLYHLGVTSPNVMLLDDIPGSFMFNDKFGGLIISPDKFVNDLALRFDAFAAELRKPDNIELRRNFEARFDFDNTARLQDDGAG
jgi:hypothetical protein